MALILGIFGILAFLAFGIAQLCAGYLGIEYLFGGIWAALALVLAILFRFTLPITIGAFFGAIYVWHWHWILAALFVSPGLAFVIPGVLIFILTTLLRPFGGTPRPVRQNKIVDLSNDPNSKTIDSA